MPVNISAQYANLKLRFLRWRMASYIRVRKISGRISYYAVSIVGILTAVLLYTPFAQQAIMQYKNVDTLFIAIGGMLGTMIALVFTLSIIPIQRAIETFSPSVSWIYRNDRITQFIYIVLALFCLLSFLFAIENVIQVSKALLLPVGIAIVGAAFDLLRWHYRRISRMLEPGIAIERLISRILDQINGTKKKISGLAQIQWDMLPPDQKKSQTKAQVETAIYVSFKNLQYPINNWTGELAEVSFKAIGKNEIYTSELAISALARIACHYMDVRKNNMIVYQSPAALFLSSECDVNAVLTPIYEHLKNANRYAVTLKNESSSIHVIKALGKITCYTATLKSSAFREYSAPITYLPLGYLKECILTAQRNGLDDPALKGSKEILNVTQIVSHNTHITDVYSPAIEAWDSIIFPFLVTGKAVLANEITNDLLAFLHQALKKKHYEFNHILSNVLDKIEALVPYAIANEKMFGSPFVGELLSIPYDLSNPLCLAYLIAEGHILIESQPDKAWINPYHDFIEMNETLYRHFRNLAEKIDFGSSFLLWHIIQTIRHIARVYLSLLENPVTDDIGHKIELVKQVPWYLAFFWVIFSKASAFNYRRADEACDALAWIGLSFYKHKFSDVPEMCISNIYSIAESYCKTSENIHPYHLADLLIYIWHIRLLAEAQTNTDLLTRIDAKLTKPTTVPEDKWKEVLIALEKRKDQLNRELRKDRRYDLNDDATSLLKQFLNRNQEGD